LKRSRSTAAIATAKRSATACWSPPSWRRRAARSPTSDRQALADLVTSLGPLPPIADVAVTQIVEAMQHDKKIVSGRLHFVLPTAIGATTIVDDVTEKEVKAALKKVGFRP
jgi:3-dehydroquinate synthetase